VLTFCKTLLQLSFSEDMRLELGRAGPSNPFLSKNRDCKLFVIRCKNPASDLLRPMLAYIPPLSSPQAELTPTDYNTFQIFLIYAQVAIPI